MKEYFVKFVSRKLFFDEFWALNHITLRIRKGEVLGIIGNNGAGKSTLLKVIAGVMKPSKGSVLVKGTMAPLIELGAGFDMDLSARENIFLNGAILGHSRKTIRQKFNQIVEFSELHDFIDLPLKNFSSGMATRLGFAIATITEPDILIVDEVLAVGDVRFQHKCRQKINSMLQNMTTVVIVSHSLEEITNMCDRVLWLEKGYAKQLGVAADVCANYRATLYPGSG